MASSNFRRNPFVHTYSSKLLYEVHRIPADKIIQLKERPVYDNFNSSKLVKIKTLYDRTSLAEQFNTASPTINSFVVDYLGDVSIPNIKNAEGTGKVYVNIAVGDYVIVKYYGMGSIALYKDTEQIKYMNILPDIDSGVSSTTSVIDKIRSFLLYENTLYLINNQKMQEIAFYNRTSTGPSDTNGGNYTDFNETYNKRAHIAITSTGPNMYITAPTTGAPKFLITNTNLENPSTSGAVRIIGEDDSASLQLGNFMFYTSGANLVKRAFVDGTAENIALGNNWKYGCMLYGNGHIYLMGNRRPGNIGQCLKINLFNDTVTALATPDASIASRKFINNTGIYKNGTIYLLDEKEALNKKLWAWGEENNKFSFITVHTNNYSTSFSAYGRTSYASSTDYSTYINGLVLGNNIIIPSAIGVTSTSFPYPSDWVKEIIVYKIPTFPIENEQYERFL